MSLTDELKQWWHDFIDHLFKHPAAAEVAHPAIVAVAQAAQPAPQPVATPAPHPNVTDLLFRPDAATAKILDDRVKNAPVAGNGWVDKSDLYGHSGGEESCARNTFQPGVERVVVLHPDTDSLALYWSDSNVSNSSVVTCFITDAAGNVVSPAKPPEQRENTHSGRQGPVSCTPGAAYPAHITLDRGGSMDLVLRDK